MLKRYWIFLSCCLFSASVQADEYSEVLNRLFTVYGGEAKIKSLNSVKQTGFTYSQARQVKGPLTRSYIYPDQMRIEIAYPDNPELRELHGKRAFKNGEPANPPFQMAATLQASRLMLPRLLLEYKSELQLRPDLDPSYVVAELVLPGDLKVLTRIHKESGQIHHSEGKGSFSGMALSFATDYEDYRQQDGTLVAFKEKHYAMGSLIGHSELSQVSFNLSLPELTSQPQAAQQPTDK